MNAMALAQRLYKKHEYPSEERLAAVIIIEQLQEIQRLRKNRHHWKTKADNFEKQLVELDKIIQKAYSKNDG